MDIKIVKETWHTYTNEKSHPYINQGVQLAIQGIVNYSILRAVSSKNPCYEALALLSMGSIEGLLIGFVASKIWLYVVPLLRQNAIYNSINQTILNEFKSLSQEIEGWFTIENDQEFIKEIERQGCLFIVSEFVFFTTSDALSKVSRRIFPQFEIVFNWKMGIGHFLINKALTLLILPK